MRSLIILLVACSTTDGTDPSEACDGLDHDGDGICDGADIDWSETAELTEPRGNLYGLPEDVLAEVRDRGMSYAYVWPVDISGMLLPRGPMEQVLSPGGDPALQSLSRTALGFGTLDEMYDWMGMPRFGPEGGEGPYRTVHPPGFAEGDPMGLGFIDTEWGEAMTFSCATCHVGQLFGRPVVGLTNKVARANAYFDLAQTILPSVTPETFAEITGADEEETAMYARTRDRLPAVGTKEPEVLGLDTSLAQVSLSLARRAQDAYATLDADAARSPRANGLDTLVADSKPMVWWTLKYKTAWLADGSIRSGNPIFTNFLWNEIGRGTELDVLETWLDDNALVVDELTAAVFATESPRWTDFFGTEGLDLDAAVRGQAVFDQTCAGCHGTYTKAWEDDPSLPVAEAVASLHLDYGATVVHDVGTDLQRAQGMTHFAEGLNGLAISEAMGTVVEVQEGYVPPPLDGIWARYPYLHNNAVPTLCALLDSALRPDVFHQGPADDPDTDYDHDCVGYPVGEATPEAWIGDVARYDTSLPGLSNAGHTFGDALSDDERSDLIAFLKTL